MLTTSTSMTSFNATTSLLKVSFYRSSLMIL